MPCPSLLTFIQNAPNAIHLNNPNSSIHRRYTWLSVLVCANASDFDRRHLLYIGHHRRLRSCQNREEFEWGFIYDVENRSPESLRCVVQDLLRYVCKKAGMSSGLILQKLKAMRDA